MIQEPWKHRIIELHYLEIKIKTKTCNIHTVNHRIFKRYICLKLPRKYFFLVFSSHCRLLSWPSKRSFSCWFFWVDDITTTSWAFPYACSTNLIEQIFLEDVAWPAAKKGVEEEGFLFSKLCWKDLLKEIGRKTLFSKWIKTLFSKWILEGESFNSLAWMERIHEKNSFPISSYAWPNLHLAWETKLLFILYNCLQWVNSIGFKKITVRCNVQIVSLNYTI